MMKFRNTNIMTKEVEKAISKMLSSLSYSTYNTDVPSQNKEEYPRVVYECELISFTSFSKYLYSLEINVYDKSKNNLYVIDISDEIINLIDGYEYRNEKLYLSCFKDLSMKVADENKSIKRNRLVFNLHIFFKKEE